MIKISTNVNVVDECIESAFMHGDTVCLDESMVKSLHKYQRKIKVIWKPQPIRNEPNNMTNVQMFNFRTSIVLDYLGNPAAINIHNNLLAGSVALMNALHTKPPYPCIFTGNNGFLSSNAYLA